jgi:hypothetical protein
MSTMEDRCKWCAECQLVAYTWKCRCLARRCCTAAPAEGHPLTPPMMQTAPAPPFVDDRTRIGETGLATLSRR